MEAADLPFWIIVIHWSARAVLVLLVLLSVWSVASMIRCYQLLRKAAGGKASGEQFVTLQSQVRSGQVAEVLAVAQPTLYQAVIKESAAVKSQQAVQIDRSVKSLLALKRTQIEAGLTVLATLGSNAPFIGLFGTVLGIIQAFGALGHQQGNSASVMAGISEALVATAVGLFVAIPAVIAFNFFSRSLRVLIVNCESLRDLYISRLKADEA